MHNLARLLCFLAALAVIEGHLLVGQSVAWMTMVTDRTPALGLQAAVADTFSGESPCQICLAIQDEREESKEQAPIPESAPHAKIIPNQFSEKRISVFSLPAAQPDHPRSDVHRTLWQTDIPSPPPWLS